VPQTPWESSIQRSPRSPIANTPEACPQIPLAASGVSPGPRSWHSSADTKAAYGLAPYPTPFTKTKHHLCLNAIQCITFTCHGLATLLKYQYVFSMYTRDVHPQPIYFGMPVCKEINYMNLRLWSRLQTNLIPIKNCKTTSKSMWFSTNHEFARMKKGAMAYQLWGLIPPWIRQKGKKRL